jgi:hypothetical protein
MTMGMLAPGLLFSQVQAQPGSGSTQETATANQPPNVTTTSPPSGSTMQPAQNPPSQPASTNPVITSLNVTQGQPGDPVMINGSNFGSGPGEVHFVIANGKDKIAAAAVWSDNQIFVSVPDETGVLAFNGTVYVKRAPDQKTSNLVSFRFEPTLEIREIRSTMDRVLKAPVDQNSAPNEIKHRNGNFIQGFKDNDLLLNMARLKNGWFTDDAIVDCLQRIDPIFGSLCEGGAYVWEIRKGTDSPHLNVRWWLGPASAIPYVYSDVWYHFAVRIIGPKGVPDGVVVP